MKKSPRSQGNGWIFPKSSLSDWCNIVYTTLIPFNISMSIETANNWFPNPLDALTKPFEAMTNPLKSLWDTLTGADKQKYEQIKENSGQERAGIASQVFGRGIRIAEDFIGLKMENMDYIGGPAKILDAVMKGDKNMFDNVKTAFLILENIPFGFGGFLKNNIVANIPGFVTLVGYADKVAGTDCAEKIQSGDPKQKEKAISDGFHNVLKLGSMITTQIQFDSLKG